MTLVAERNLGARLRSAARIEPDRLPRLKLVGDEWAAAVETGLASDFEAPAKLSYEGAAPLARPSEGGDTPALVLVAASPAWSQPALLLADAALAGFAAECLLGGDGSRPAPAGRTPSELDRRFCRFLLERFVEAGNGALAPVMDAAMRTDRVHSEALPERLESFAIDGALRYTAFAFRLTLGRCEGTVRVALPDAVLGLARRKLDHLPEPAVPRVDAAWARDIEEGLLDAEMTLTALLDEKTTTLGAIAALRIGQTIVLDAGVDSAITIECEEQRLFRGLMGRSRDSYLVRIEEKIDPTEEFIDDILAD